MKRRRTGKGEGSRRFSYLCQPCLPSIPSLLFNFNDRPRRVVPPRRHCYPMMHVVHCFHPPRNTTQRTTWTSAPPRGEAQQGRCLSILLDFHEPPKRFMSSSFKRINRRMRSSPSTGHAMTLPCRRHRRRPSPSQPISQPPPFLTTSTAP